MYMPASSIVSQLRMVELKVDDSNPSTVNEKIVSQRSSDKLVTF